MYSVESATQYVTALIALIVTLIHLIRAMRRALAYLRKLLVEWQTLRLQFA